MKQFFARTFWNALGMMAALYAIGILGYYTSFAPILLLLMIIASAVCAYKRVDVAMYLVFIELFSNPHGALLLVPVGGFEVSMRMAIFLGVMTGWGIGIITKRYQINTSHPMVHTYAPLALAIIIGITAGFLSYNPIEAFKDANAYLYVAYLLPLLSVEWSGKQKHELLQILAAGAIWATLISMTILYVFTHFWVALLSAFYELLRDLRIAEVTELGSGTYRVFVQSQLFTIIFGGLVLAMSPTQDKKRWALGLGAMVVAITALSLSRSFWVGIIPALIIALGLMIKTYIPSIKQAVTFVGWSALTGLAGILLIAAVTLFPIPSPTFGGDHLVDSLKDRTTQTSDAGISSRWNLLWPMIDTIFESPVMGSGFGTAVTFTTDDPRARAINPDGTWTTTSMEWGWLELWIKMGILGPLAFLYIGYEYLKRLWGYLNTEQAWIGIGLITALLFVFGTHVFSPYLNHPIGLGVLLFIIPFLSTKKQMAPSVTSVIWEELRWDTGSSEATAPVSSTNAQVN